MKILIINLKQSVDRLTQQQQQFAKLGLEFERLESVTVNDIDETYYRNKLTQGQRVLKQTEHACLLSHKKAWQYTLAHQEPILILEDDAILATDLAKILGEIENANLDVDLINLEVHGRKKIVSRNPAVILDKDFSLYALHMDKSGAAAYILYPSGAQKLLGRIDNHLDLADAFIHSCPNLSCLQIEPAAAVQSDRCSWYGIDFQEYRLQSMIGTIGNTLTIQPTQWQKIKLRINRITSQIHLGIRTLYALTQGIKRDIRVNADKFIK